MRRLRWGHAAGLAFLLSSSPVAAVPDPDCELANPEVGSARLDVTVTRSGSGYRYEYLIINPASSTGCVFGAMVDVRTSVSGGLITVGAGLVRGPDAPGSFVVSGTYSVPAVAACGGGVGGIGKVSCR